MSFFIQHMYTHAHKLATLRSTIRNSCTTSITTVRRRRRSTHEQFLYDDCRQSLILSAKPHLFPMWIRIGFFFLFRKNFWRHFDSASKGKEILHFYTYYQYVKVFTKCHFLRGLVKHIKSFCFKADNHIAYYVWMFLVLPLAAFKTFNLAETFKVPHLKWNIIFKLFLYL